MHDIPLPSSYSNNKYGCSDCREISLLLNITWYSFIFLILYCIAPSAPTNITAIEIASTYAIISWATPEFPNGIIRSYTVLVTKNNGVLVSNMSTPEMAVNITDLSPFVQYWLVVFAQTVEIGEGSANFSLLTAEAGKFIQLALCHFKNCAFEKNSTGIIIVAIEKLFI